MSSKPCNLVVTFQKNFFLAGETAYFGIFLDNSQCADACTIEISHKTKIQQVSKWRNYSSTITNRSETVHGAAANEAAKTFYVPFQVGAKKLNQVTKIKYPENYLMLANMIPESGYFNTYHVKNYFKIYLRHENTTFSNNSASKYAFQLIQPSLVEGVIDVPPPLFVDTNGIPLVYNQPAYFQPA